VKCEGSRAISGPPVAAIDAPKPRALGAYLTYYVICLLLTWRFYARRS
jgi:hypothetical protein